MTNRPSLRSALALLTLAVLLAASAARADGMGFFGVPSAEEAPAPAKPAAHHHAAPARKATARPHAGRSSGQVHPPLAARAAHTKSRAANASARPVALAAIPAPKAAAPQPARSSEDEGLVELVEAPHRGAASR